MAQMDSSLSFNVFLSSPDKNAKDINNSIKESTASETLSLTASTIINQKAIANNSGIPIGAILNTSPSSVDDIVQLKKQPICCPRCGSVINPYCRVGEKNKRWNCNFCGLINTEPLPFCEDTEDQGFPEIEEYVVDYVSEEFMEIGENEIQKEIVLFLLDTTLDMTEMAATKMAIEKILLNLKDNVFVGIISFDSCLSLYDMENNNKDLLEATCIPGHTIVIPHNSRSILAGHLIKIKKLAECRDSLINLIKLIIHQCVGVETGLNVKRCLGSAVHEALMMIQEFRTNKDKNKESLNSLSPGKDKIIVFTAGAATYGPGALPSEFFDSCDFDLKNNKLAKESLEFISKTAAISQEMSVIVDFYGIGPMASQVCVMQPLAQACNGIISTHFCVSAEVLSSGVLSSFDRQFGYFGVLDVRLSPGLRLTSITGTISGKLLKDEFGNKKMTDNACLLGALQIGKSYALEIEASRNFTSENLYIQTYLSWIKIGTNIRVTRIVTSKISTTGNLMEFLKSVNPVTCSVFMTKKVVLEATSIVRAGGSNKKLEDLRLSLSVKASYLAQRFGKLLEEKSTGILWFFGVKQTWSCPQELMYIFQVLYYLQKSPLLHSGFPQRTLNASLMHSLVLSSSLDYTDCLALPRFYHISTSIVRLPANDMALASDCILLIDHGTHLFIWIGSSVTDAEVLVKVGVEICCNISKTRSPSPGLKIITEGSGDERYILANLNCIRGDSVKDIRDQTTGPLNSAERIRLEQLLSVNKDEVSFYKWCRQMDIEPPRRNLADILIGVNETS